MIRLTYALRRKAGLSFEEFQAYWQEQHGPLVASVSQRLNIRRYVQVHTLHNPDGEQKIGQRGKLQKPFDGIAELWFDSIETLRESQTSESAIKASTELLEDEKQFIDLAQSPGWIGYECPQINPSPENLVATPDSPYAKFYYLLNHPEDQAFDDVQQYWRVNHGPLVRRFGPALQILRYVQVHRLEDEFNQMFADSRGIQVQPYFGHAELWYNQNTMGLRSPESTRGALALYEDEARFIDFSRSALWFGKELVFVDCR